MWYTFNIYIYICTHCSYFLGGIFIPHIEAGRQTKQFLESPLLEFMIFTFWVEVCCILDWCQVCASEHGLYFIIESENLAHMVFSGKHQCLQAKWEQQGTTYYSRLRSLTIKVNCGIWNSNQKWNWLTTALTLILQRLCNLKMLSFSLFIASCTPDFMRHVVWDRLWKIRGEVPNPL